MKISQSQVQLSAQQSEAASARLSGFAVSVTDTDGDTPATDQASILLSLSSRTQESAAVSRSSNVTSATGSSQSSSAWLAERLTEQVSQLEITVTASFPQNISSGTATLVEVQSILQLQQEDALSFEALGQVQTEDGRRIDFMLALDLYRKREEEQINQFSGEVNLIDPLMINLNGGAVELTDQFFYFDLNADGQDERLARTASGSGYLAFDKNGNGIIDDGSELFGPQNGDGFADLAQYDDDGNGWIDENDAIFSQLSIMDFNAAGEMQLSSASAAGVGALYLGSVASDYELQNGQGELQGVIRRSGVALSENGDALLLQEIHLNSYPSPVQPAYTHSAQSIPTDSGSMVIDSALSFFQFDNEILNSRNEHTLVRLQTRFTQDALISVAGPLNNNAGGSTPALTPASQPAQHNGTTTAASQLSLRQWVSRVVSANLTDSGQGPSGHDGELKNWSVAVNTTPLNLRDELHTDSNHHDSRVLQLRAAIDELKEMQRQQQENNRQLFLYKMVGRLAR
ncbi:MAG: hypothetical protein KYX62_02815 [Pseudomonadota bacterium]|nr:hypothetical protein [Pseudomonadota bacterium]